MSTGAKTIGGHEVQTERKLDKYGGGETHTCLKCGLSADNITDLLALNCNHE